MSTPTRRQALASALGAAAGAALSSPAWAIDPIRRGKTASLKASIAAYSVRDHFTGKLAPAMSLLDFVELAADWGWDAVELTSYYFPAEITPKYLSELKRTCYLLGLDISGISVRNDFTAPAGEARDKDMAHVRKWLGYGHALGAPAMRIFAGSVKPGQAEADACRNVAETIDLLANDAERAGVILGIENHGGVTAESSGTLSIVKQVKTDWCGINLDTGNFRTAEPYADMAACAPYAITTHVKTEVSPKGKPKEPADFARIARILRDAKYRGYMTLEYEAAEAPMTAAPKALEAIRRAIAG